MTPHPPEDGIVKELQKRLRERAEDGCEGDLLGVCCGEDGEPGDPSLWCDPCLMSGALSLIERREGENQALLDFLESCLCGECGGSGRTDNHVTGEVECSSCEGTGHDSRKAFAKLADAQGEIARLNTALDTLSKAVSHSEQGKILKRAEKAERDAIRAKKPAYLPPPFDKQELTRRVAGAVKSMIDNHGPITLENRSSLTKRITGELYVRQSVSAPLAELRAGLEAAERENHALRAYVQHGDGCDAWPQFTGHFQQASKVGSCTCGLSALLSPSPVPESKGGKV